MPLVVDRSHAPAWERGHGRSASTTRAPKVLPHHRWSTQGTLYGGSSSISTSGLSGYTLISNAHESAAAC